MKVPAQRGSARAKVVTAVGVTVLATATAAVIAGPARAATASSPSGGRASQVVFAQTNNTAGNQVVVYDRAGRERDLAGSVGARLWHHPGRHRSRDWPSLRDRHGQARRLSDLRVGAQPTSVTFFASSNGGTLRLTAAVDSPARNR